MARNVLINSHGSEHCWPLRQRLLTAATKEHFLPHSRKVLIIEDEEVLARNLRHYFRRCGWDARTAGTGKLAVEIACQYRPGLILFDYHLPDMSGFQALEAIRARHCCSGVLMTARSEDETVRAGARRHGILRILAKPFPLARLKGLMLAWAAEPCSKYLANVHRPDQAGCGGIRASPTGCCHLDLGALTQSPKIFGDITHPYEEAALCPSRTQWRATGRIQLGSA